MKTDVEILREGKVIAGYGDHKLVVLNGQVYPFWGKNMRNPLDPWTLLDAICKEGSNNSNADVVYWARKILNTVREASKIRSSGYSIVTKYKSGSPRAIIDTATNNVIILGELCTRKELILPILSVQLSDDDYRQENVEAWRKRGFSVPIRYNCEYSKGSWENDGTGPDCTWKRRTIETWSLRGEEFSIIREEENRSDSRPGTSGREYFRREESDED
jgi:hypothetical protein